MFLRRKTDRPLSMKVAFDALPKLSCISAGGSAARGLNDCTCDDTTSTRGDSSGCRATLSVAILYSTL